MVAKRKQEKKKSEEEILFPEIEVDGIKVKPWSLGILAELSPSIESIINKLEKIGIDLDNLTLSSIMKIYLAIAPEASYIISKTTGISEDEVKEYDMKKAMLLLRTIWLQNQDNVKNGLALFGLEDEEIVSPEEEKE